MMKEMQWDFAIPLIKAETSKERQKGLIGREDIDFALLIPLCPLVHTFRMKEDIDIVFLRGAKVQSLYENVTPRRLRGSLASLCLELPAGSIERFSIKKGDTLSIR
jgi:uncharacterized membrane protein (UPF0127 family)